MLVKRLFPLVLICALAIAAVTGGTLLHATAATIRNEVVTGINYKYLRKPLMLAANASHIYVVNESAAAQYQLVVMDKDGLVPDFAIELDFLPLHISAAGIYVFLFDTNFFYALNTNNLNTPTISSARPNAVPTDCTAFHATFTPSPSGGDYRLYFASDNKYNWYEFKDLSLPMFPASAEPQSLEKTTLKISGITTDNTNIYLSAGVSPIARQIYRHGTAVPLADETFPEMTSLTFAGNRLVFIISPDIHVMNPSNPPSSAPFTNVLAGDTKTLSTEKSNRPIFVSAVSANELYVIDSFKASVDLYRLVGDKLEFVKNVAAHRGGDRGYHFFPTSICVIDEHRYVISDEAGVKLIDTSKPKDQQLVPVSALTYITEIVYDRFESVYLYGVGGVVHKFDINKHNVVTPKGTVNKSEADANKAKQEITALGDPYTPSFPAGATFAAGFDLATSAMWSLDRLGGRLYWLAANHLVQSVDIDGYWSPKGKGHHKWNDNKPLEYTEVETGLFMKTKETAAGAVLYEYPNDIGPIHNIGAGKEVKILKYNAVMYEQNGTPVTFNNPPGKGYAFVLYGSYGEGYISHELLETTDFATTSLGFDTRNKGYNQNDEYVGYSGRVLLHNVQLYKYPTASSPIVGYVHRNHGLAADPQWPGLKLHRLITVVDADGSKYYEVRVDTSGIAPKDGYIDPVAHRFVGYIDVQRVIDTYRAPSLQKFSPNASIKAKSGEKIQVYQNGDANNPVPYEDEFLVNRDRIRLPQKIDKKVKYTQVYYYGFQSELPGYVETKYIAPDGITAWQIVAIVGLITSVSVGVFIGVRHIRANRKNSDTTTV